MPSGTPLSSRTVICVICGSQFETKHSQGKYCSEGCRRIGWRSSWSKYRQKNRERINEYHRQLYESDVESACARVAAYHATPSGSITRKRADINNALRHPLETSARRAVNRAVANGSIQKQPCFICGASNVQGHHTDYSKPLDVIWLCNKCHRAEHKRLKQRATQGTKPAHHKEEPI